MTSVSLRPVSGADLDLFEGRFYNRAGTGEFQWFGFRPPHEDRRGHEANGLLTPEAGSLSVVAADETVGRVNWFRSSWGPPQNSWCWTIAIGLLPESQGRGIGTEAQRQLTDYLFAISRADRIQAWTDAENLAERQALRKAGFHQEGVIRSAQWRMGSWHDQVLFSRLRGEE